MASTHASPDRSGRCSARLLALVLLAVLALLLLATGAHAAETLYTCGMHPQIIKHEPGNCPICGMKLTPIRANSGGAPGTATGGRKIQYYRSTMNPGETRATPGNDSMGMAMEPVYEDAGAASALHIDAATVQRMNLKTGVVTQGPVRRTLRAVGSVAYNEGGLQDITTKYEGWIEKLHVATTWTRVKAGEPLFDMYSPDLYNAQMNYVVASRGEGEAGGPLSRAALARLQLFDVPEAFIRRLAETKEPQRIFTFRAPADGVVIEKMAVQGQMMKPGERIYRIADLSSVWVEAQIYENDLPFVQAGQSATVRVTYGPTQELKAEVSLILPQVSEQTRTATARLVVPNEGGQLRPGMFVDVLFSAQIADSAVLVPDVAVLRSGEHNTVFLARGDGTFEPREVRLGSRSEGGFYQVLSGLAAGERVVTSGQFMLDSESQLREAIQKMLRADTNAPHEAGPAAPPTTNLLPAAAEARPGTPSSPGPAAAASAELKALTLATADATATLGKDDMAGYRERLPAVRDALKAYLEADPHASHGPLGNASAALADPADLPAARKSFVAFSTAVTDLARSAGLSRTEALHVFECPMAPVLGTGRWLQREAEMRNPFFGKPMKDCGTELDTTAAPASAPATQSTPPQASRTWRLPPGHPPIGEVSVVDFLRSEAARRNTRPAAAAGGAACGSCGMSAEAMAAGEPCEHPASTQPVAAPTGI